MGMPTAVSSGVLVPGTYTLFAGRHTLNGITALPGATVTVYDNPLAASGPIVETVVNAGTNTVHANYSRAIRLENGLTVVVAAANAIVRFGAS